MYKNWNAHEPSGGSEDCMEMLFKEFVDAQMTRGMIKYVVMETILFVNKGSVIICRLLESIRESILFVCLPVLVKKFKTL